jgi:hypothetical protein
MNPVRQLRILSPRPFRRRRLLCAGFVALATVCSTALPASAQDQADRIGRLEQQVEELRRAVEAREDRDLATLRRQIEALTAELERLRLGDDVVRADTSRFGFGPGASKVYGAAQGVSIGGYGEMLYENFADEREDGTAVDARSQLDFLRAILYAGYKFDSHFVLNTEIEFEHGSTEQAGSVSVEFAYLDYLFSERAGVRAGLLLLPLGFVNELHEPTTFLGTERPETERRIIPSTWREGGIGVFADFDDVQLRGYIVNGLDAVGGGSSAAEGFSAEGIRGGRQNGSKAIAEDIAVAARADYTGFPGLVLGTSGFLGEAGQNAADPTSPGDRLGVRTLILEGHAGYRANGFDVRALFATTHVDDAAALNATLGLTGNESVGERLTGWYAHAGYDVLRAAATQVELTPYVRYESIDTQATVPDGFAADPANDLAIWTFGAALRPISQLIVKADYQMRSTGADTGVNQFDVALGYIF